jgi:hypothetical protein
MSLLCFFFSVSIIQYLYEKKTFRYWQREQVVLRTTNCERSSPSDQSRMVHIEFINEDYNKGEISSSEDVAICLGGGGGWVFCTSQTIILHSHILSMLAPIPETRTVTHNTFFSQMWFNLTW